MFFDLSKRQKWREKRFFSALVIFVKAFLHSDDPKIISLSTKKLSKHINDFNRPKEFPRRKKNAKKQRKNIFSSFFPFAKGNRSLVKKTTKTANDPLDVSAKKRKKERKNSADFFPSLMYIT